MRTPAEIAFRLKQEITNAWLLWRPPSVQADTEAPLSGLAHPERVAEAIRDSLFASQVQDIAGRILDHTFPILGIELATGSDIYWRRDYLAGVETPAAYFRRIPYLDVSRAGDHKIIWELNRHQHLVLLAQARLLTGRTEYSDELFKQLESWWSANPFQRGMNWTSALEVAFRALAWIWVYHLAGELMSVSFRKRFLTELYRHGRHLAANLSIYFSPNTHLLGEAVALHALGRLFPAFPEAPTWRQTGARIVAAEMEHQVRTDGSHFEQSSYYHVYAVDMFLFHSLLETTTEHYREKLAAMAVYLDALLGPARKLPFLGDDDGGRFFHPYGTRSQFGRATIASCAAALGRDTFLYDKNDLYEQAVWWLGPEVLSMNARGKYQATSKFFRNAGVAILAADDHQIIVDAGPFGDGSAGHSHSDTLSVIARNGVAELLVDPGTYTYIGDAGWRQRFRGSAAHNTIRVDGRDQAVPAGPFRWMQPPAVAVRNWTTHLHMDEIDAECRYAGITHRRRVRFRKPAVVIIIDELTGDGAHLIEQFWHLGNYAELQRDRCARIGENAYLTVANGALELFEAEEHGWISDAPGTKRSAHVLRVKVEQTLPLTLATVLSFTPNPCLVELLGHPLEMVVTSPEINFHMQL